MDSRTPWLGRRAALPWKASLLVLCVAGGISCRGDGAGLTSSGDPPTTGLSRIQPIFDANCTRCHSPGGIGYLGTGGDTGNGLDLTPGSSHGKLVNQRTFEAPATQPRWRVLPGQPDSSYIIQKISSPLPKFGARMPLDGPPYLSTADIELIRMWIQEGAPR